MPNSTSPSSTTRRYLGHLINQQFGVGFAEDAFGGGPVDAGVGDADAVFEFGAVGDGLVAFFEVAFDHEADEGFVAAGALLDDDAGDFLLLAMLFVGVGVAAIDHEDGILTA